MCFVIYTMQELQLEKRGETETEREGEGRRDKKTDPLEGKNKSLSSSHPCQVGIAAARGHLARWAKA